MANINIRGVIVPDDDAWLYDYMGIAYTAPQNVADAITSAPEGDALDVYINSPGGEISAGSEIYAALQRAGDRVRIHITGEACSAASVIAMAGYCDMAPTARMMVHHVSTCASGDYHDMDDASAALQTANRAIAAAYVRKSGMTEDYALTMMDAETWLTAEDALARGLIDAIAGPQDDKNSAAGQLVNSDAALLSEDVKLQLRTKRNQLIMWFNKLEDNA